MQNIIVVKMSDGFGCCNSVGTGFCWRLLQRLFSQNRVSNKEFWKCQHIKRSWYIWLWPWQPIVIVMHFFQNLLFEIWGEQKYLIYCRSHSFISCFNLETSSPQKKQFFFQWRIILGQYIVKSVSQMKILCKSSLKYKYILLSHCPWLHLCDAPEIEHEYVILRNEKYGQTHKYKYGQTHKYSNIFCKCRWGGKTNR